MKGKLTLIPTPIDEEHDLDNYAYSLLMRASNEEKERSVFVIEDLKPGRKRWLKWKLPREQVDQFVLYNEHSANDVCHQLLLALKDGKNVYLMSDGGLPAFCDPGIELVSMCHDAGIVVTSTPFYNSISLALALSGFSHSRFQFEGFLAVKEPMRTNDMERVMLDKQTVILMDTPYRLKKLLEEIELIQIKLNIKRRIFLAMDLNSSKEELLRGYVSNIAKRVTDFKREFILILESCERKK